MMFSIKTNELPVVRFIGEVTYKQPWTHFTRTANEYIIYIVKKGSLYIEEGEKKYTLNKNDFFIFEPNITHKGYKAASCEYFFIHFNHENIKARKIIDEVSFSEELQMRRYQAMTSNCLLNSFAYDSTCYLPKYFHLAYFDHYNVILREAIDNYNLHEENYKEIVSCELLNMLIGISREFATLNIHSNRKSIKKSLFTSQEILNYLNKEYSKKITSVDISEKFEGNFDYLNRCFKEMTNHTIFSYLNLIRINKAKELILTSHMKFSEIGYLVGIDNPYYFSRLFKKTVGKTPTAYYNEHYRN